MESDAYNIIPSPVCVSALQSQNKEQLTVYEGIFGYELDEETTNQLTKPQLHYIITIEPIYTKGIQISPTAIKRVVDAHPDIYIVIEDMVYIDPVIYSFDKITSYAQGLIQTAYEVQKSMNNSS